MKFTKKYNLKNFSLVCLILFFGIVGNAFAEKINVKNFGAKGDGKNDDTLAIQSTVNAIPDSGGTVFFPPGKYKISKTININRSNLFFVGSGVTKSTILFNRVAQMVVVQPLAKIPISNFLFKGIRYVNSGKTLAKPGKMSGYGRAAIHLDPYFAKISKVIITENFIDGGPTVGIGVSGEDITVIKNKIVATDQHGIYLSVGRNIRIVDNDLSGIGLKSPIGSQSAIKISHGHKVFVGKNRIKNLGHEISGINAESTSSNVSINDNSISLSDRNQVGLRIHAEKVTALGNRIDGGNGYQNSFAIDVKDGTGASFTDTKVIGSWKSSAVSVRNGVSDVLFDRLEILKGSKRSWAIDLRNSIRPTIQNSSILSGSLGISLGKTDGARITNTQIFVTDERYGLGKKPTNCVIMENGRNICQTLR